MSAMTDALRARLVTTPLPPIGRAAVLRAVEAVEAQETAIRLGQEGVWLRSINVEGFRGIGTATTLEVAPGPGLTVVVGRNGSGKSSFAEALELLFRGTSHRWEGRQAVWKGGWRNLHHDGEALVTVQLSAVGSGSEITCSRQWPPASTGVEDGAEQVLLDGETQPGGLEALGWGSALRTHQPWISHPQLAGLLNGKLVDLYDEIARLLGLEDVQGVLRQVRSEKAALEAAPKALEQRTADLLTALATSGSQQARDAQELMRLDLAALEALEARLSAGAAHSRHGALRELMGWTVPDQAGVTALRDEATALAQAFEQLAETREGQLSAVAEVLSLALQLPEQADDCPVCDRERGWDAEARALGQNRLEALRRASRRAEALQAQRAALLGRVAGLTRCAPPDVLLARANPEAAQHWRAEPLGLVAAALWLEQLRSRLGHWVEHREAALAELSAEDAVWSELRGPLLQWVVDARAVLQADDERRALAAADAWVVAAERALRDELFAPLAAVSSEMWSLLRQDSSIALGGVLLRGAGPRRHLGLDVSVDGQPSSALSVMSQGELNALALSLFLPRMLRDESPFRFAVIDDPVQALDPHKVDGLARVLGVAATARQILVFTHDPRLPEALRRLGIPAVVLSVERGSASQVAVRVVSTPWRERLLDAERVLQASGSLGHALIAQSVPAILREAVEAALRHALGRRAHAGAAAASQPQALASQNLVGLLALWTNAGRRPANLHAAVVEHFGHDGAETLSLLQAGAHRELADPNGLRNRTAALCAGIVQE